MARLTIGILGGTGFVGSALTTALSDRGHRVRVFTRRRARHRELTVLPRVDVVETNVFDGTALAAGLAGCDAAVNLVGILNERGDSGKGFRRVHVELVHTLVQACREAGVGRLLHMSALNADAKDGASHYLRSKGEGEEAAHAAAGLAVTSFRPSVIFGPADSFFNRFADLLELAPVFPVACPKARFAPVFVGDVAAAFAHALEDPATIGQRYDLCGPRSYSFRELLDYTAAVLGVRRRFINLGPGLSRLQANVFEYVPGKPFSRDNLRSLAVDSVCKGPFPEVFGITPTPVDAVVPRYLGAVERNKRLQHWRRAARRDR